MERILTMIQVLHIKFLYEEKGYSLRKIANETGHDFKTVQNKLVINSIPQHFFMPWT